MMLNKKRRNKDVKKDLMFALAVLISVAFVATGFAQEKAKPAAAPAPAKK